MFYILDIWQVDTENLSSHIVCVCLLSHHFQPQRFKGSIQVILHITPLYPPFRVSIFLGFRFMCLDSPTLPKLLGSKSHYHYFFQAKSRVDLVASLNSEFTNCKFMFFFPSFVCCPFLQVFPLIQFRDVITTIWGFQFHYEKIMFITTCLFSCNIVLLNIFQLHCTNCNKLNFLIVFFFISVCNS